MVLHIIMNKLGSQSIVVRETKSYNMSRSK